MATLRSGGADLTGPASRTLGRRGFLSCAAALAVAGSGKAALAHRVLEANEGDPVLVPGVPRRLHLRNAHTGEVFEGLYRDADGPIKPAVRDLDKVLRDHRQSATIPIDVGVFDLLSALSDRVTGGDPLTYTVVSGYRTRQTNEMLRRYSDWVAEESLHIHGQAIDLFAEDVPLEALNEHALTLSRGGVGFYPQAGFLHLDVGTVRHWVRRGRSGGARLVAGLDRWPEPAPVAPTLGTGATDPSLGGQSLGTAPGQYGSSIGSLSTGGFGAAPRIGGQSLGAAPTW